MTSLKPQSEADLAEAIKSAKGPLHIRGGGTRRTGAELGQVLETGGLSGISLYEPGALTVVAGAGTPLAEIEAALDAENQRLAFEPMDHRGLLGTTGAPTLGGVAAANVSGPRRIQCGAARDFMLGVRFVDGQGSIVKNGGRVMKNVTGYDLVKLMAGSQGTLGVLTEVSLKVLPKPETMACLLIDGLNDRDAINAMTRAMGSPYDVTGAAHLPKGLDGTPVTMIRIEGFSASVAYRLEQLAGLFPNHALRRETDPEAVAKGWAYIRDAEPFHGTTGDVWRISTKPTEAPDLAAKLDAKEVFYDWSGGLIWALTPAGSDIRAKLGVFDGHATLVRSSGTTMPLFHPQPAPVAMLSEGVRRKFDPRGILNPGLMTA